MGEGYSAFPLISIVRQEKVIICKCGRKRAAVRFPARTATEVSLWPLGECTIPNISQGKENSMIVDSAQKSSTTTMPPSAECIKNSLCANRENIKFIQADISLSAGGFYAR
jgi:hypothetical protein